MAGRPVPRRGRAGRVGLGRRLRRALTGLLVAFSGALLLRPVLLLISAIGPDTSTSLVAAATATVFHVVVFSLAVSLFRRAR